MDAYEDKQFQQFVRQSFECVICNNVIQDPVTCQNGNLFCRACITRHLMNYHTCPSCTAPLTVETLIEASRPVANLLSDLKSGCELFLCMVVVAGGENRVTSLKSVEVFSLTTGKWRPLQPMKECREAASSVVHNNQFIVMGGWNNGSMEKLSLNAVQADQSIPWENISPELPGKLMGHCSVVYSRRLIVAGGYDADKGAYSDSITEISLVQPYASKRLATMPQTRCYHGVAIFGDKILIFGGRESFGSNSALKSVVMYDITKNECQELVPLPNPVSEMATVKWGQDNVMIIGGIDSDGKALNNILMYNIKNQMNYELPHMKYKRKGCMAAVVRNTVIVMGGRDEEGNYLKSVESFRFDSYSWEELAQMNEARNHATAVVC